MPSFTFMSPDGKSYTVNGPEGATKEQAFSLLQQQLSGAASHTTATPQKAPDPTEGNNFFENALIGVGKGFHDIGQGVGQRVRDALEASGGKHIADEMGLPTQADVAESRRIDAPLMNTAGGKVGNFVGHAVPAAVAMAVPGGATLAGSAITGGALGALEPTTEGESVLKNAAFGAGGGAAGYGAAKAVGAGINAIRTAAQPFYESGQNAIVGNAIRNAAGTEADALAAQRALATVKSAVPGVDLTAGQASGNAGIAALERTASAVNPTVTQAYAERIAAQNAAHVAALEDVAGTSGAREFFAADRDAAAKALYKDAIEQGVDPATITPYVKGQITQLLKRPSIQSAMDQAKNLAAEEGLKLNDMTSIQGLHYVKQALDDQIASSVRAGTDTLTSKLMGTKDMLINVMDKLSPAYAEARQTYAAMSKPVNQMDIAQAVADKAINKLTGNLQPNAYANALTDATAKKATGFSGTTLENTMEPDQMAVLSAIKEDLARKVFAQNAGRGPGSDTVQKLAYSNMLGGMSVPGFVRNFGPSQVIGNLASRVADAAYGRANKELSTKLAESLLDTSSTSAMIKEAMDSVRNSGIISGAAQKVAPITGVLGITSAPMLVNKSQ